MQRSRVGVDENDELFAGPPCHVGLSLRQSLHVGGDFGGRGTTAGQKPEYHRCSAARDSIRHSSVRRGNVREDGQL